MASLYVPSYITLDRDPRVLRLARHLQTDRFQALGIIHAFWYWCVQYAPEGRLDEVSSEDIAQGTGLPGDVDIIEAMELAGFVKDGEVADWEKSGGKIIKKRAQDVARKRFHGNSTEVPRKFQGNSTEEDEDEDEDQMEIRWNSMEIPPLDEDKEFPRNSDGNSKTKEVIATVMLGLPRTASEDARTLRQAADLAEDFSIEEITAAIAALRKTSNKLPWPSHIRGQILKAQGPKTWDAGRDALEDLPAAFRTEIP